MTKRPKPPARKEKQPRQDMATVGTDVVDRAKVRFIVGSAGSEKFKQMLRDRIDVLDGSTECVVCHWSPYRGTSWKRSKVGGRDVAICDRCAQFAVSVCDYHPDLRSCLTILAINVEQACHDQWDDQHGNAVPTSGILRRIQNSFWANWYATCCECPRHQAARREFDRDIVGPIFRPFTPPPPKGSNPDVTGLPLAMVRTFQEKGLLFEGKVMDRRDVVRILQDRNDSETAYPGMKPGGLAERALKLATQANAKRWSEGHSWERANNAPFPGINDKRGPDVVELDLVDVDLLNRVLDRPVEDDRPYCDWCGSFEDGTTTDGVTFCCPDCARSSNLVGSRINRLYSWLRAYRAGRPITFVGPDGKS